MLSSKLFPWQKNKKKHTIYKNEKNEELIQELRSEGIADEKILTAIRAVPRELFTEKLDEAYENKALSVGCGQTLTQPFCTAYMASFLNLRETDNILDIGCGVGWSTAVISRLCKTVFVMERFKKLLDIAKKILQNLKLKTFSLNLGTDSKDGEIKLYLMQLLLVRLQKLCQ